MGPTAAVTALCMRVRVLETRRASDLQFSEFWFLRPYGEHVQPKLITATGNSECRSSFSVLVSGVEGMAGAPLSPKSDKCWPDW